ncbi:NAD(P)-dependent oxidoreductase [Thalassospiraceae bacterium LMO-JJ14]|nr:NAD(P)-dependent oxidoreductase [Thalassospiraceae bacterium LMO-JJ14]
MSEKLHIVVTGGAGYLGSIMVPAFLDAGHKVTVLDNFMFKQNPLAHVCANPDFDVVRGDARDEGLIKGLVKDADVVIPLAALVGAPLCNNDQIGTETINRDAVIMMLKLLSKDQRILMPITNSGYGIGEKGKFCTEETPLRPISLYGTTKVEAEAAALERGNAISFRLATVFGMAPRFRLDLLVNDFVYRAVHDRAVVLFEADFKRNYIHIRDVARAFLHGLENFESMKNEPYNVGLSDANLSKRELCEKIHEHIPSFVFMEAPIGEDPDKRDYIVSNEKIEKTGFMPAYSLDDGIKELIKGYRMIRNSLYGNV